MNTNTNISQAIKELNELNFFENTCIKLTQNGAEFFLVEKEDGEEFKMFTSDVRVFNNTVFNGKPYEFKISTPNSGAFTPDNKASKARYLNTATLINNWDKVVDILTKYLEAFNLNFNNNDTP